MLPLCLLFYYFAQIPETGVIFLNASEHLFHIRLGEVNQDRTAMRGSYRVVTLGQLVDQVACRVIVQRVVGLDGAFAGHHDGQLCPVFLDRHFLGQKEHITHFVDTRLDLFFLHPDRMLPQDQLVSSIFF